MSVGAYATLAGQVVATGWLSPYVQSLFTTVGGPVLGYVAPLVTNLAVGAAINGGLGLINRFRNKESSPAVAHAIAELDSSAVDPQSFPEYKRATEAIAQIENRVQQYADRALNANILTKEDLEELIRLTREQEQVMRRQYELRGETLSKAESDNILVTPSLIADHVNSERIRRAAAAPATVLPAPAPAVRLPLTYPPATHQPAHQRPAIAHTNARPAAAVAPSQSARRAAADTADYSRPNHVSYGAPLSPRSQQLAASTPFKQPSASSSRHNKKKSSSRVTPSRAPRKTKSVGKSPRRNSPIRYGR